MYSPAARGYALPTLQPAALPTMSAGPGTGAPGGRGGGFLASPALQSNHIPLTEMSDFESRDSIKGTHVGKKLREGVGMIK